MNAKPRVRIESDGARTARVLVDDVDVSCTVTAVSWTMSVGGPAYATVDFRDVQIEAEGELPDSEPSRPADAELRAHDLTILDVKPGDTILLRHEKHIDDTDRAAITGSVTRQFPGHEVLILDGGLELSVLRPVAEPHPMQAP